MTTDKFTPFSRITDAKAEAMGIVDANESLLLSRDLVAVEERVYRTEYPLTAARMMIPKGSGVPAREGPYSWKRIVEVGEDQAYGIGMTDAPTVDAYGVETTGRVVGIPRAYLYSWNDQQISGQTRVDIIAERATSARDLIERQIDKDAIVGNSALGLTGLASASGVNTTTITGSWNASGRTADEILADVMKMYATVVGQSKGAFMPDALAVPTRAWTYILKPRSTASDETVLGFVKRNLPGLQVFHSPQLDNVGTNGRSVMWKRTADVADLVIPQEFTMLPPQPRNAAFSVYCFALFGGVRVRYPVAMTYADNTLDSSGAF